ncbi:glycoprotease family protein [Chlamydia ibidis]|uniref:Glycoprotease family protein n=2 Tax=Chlamydia ibidis TaxID=1405396 RepID=S7KIW4_9CHLA|nr:tRNA (adenosine(37)-N6)-threonylcarbamoyltransferase complex dimerization subunit type 1 TsaB [Chlamydia ibidis]EPP34350.1 glycoprotease family protein [Chlamydia ibidis]
MHFYNCLIIDTSGYQPFLAHVDAQKVLNSWSLPLGPDQGLVLDFIVKNLSLSFQGIGVAVGPGNFSSTRVGLAFAQGLSLAAKVPLVGYSSLEGYLSKGEKTKGLMLPLGKKGGVLTLSCDLSDNGLVCGEDGVGPGMLLSYEEASAICLERNCSHVVSPNPDLFRDAFSKEIYIEKMSPSLECIRSHVISQLMLLSCHPQLTPDYRSCSSFF